MDIYTVVDVNAKKARQQQPSKLGTEDENPYETAIEAQHETPVNHAPEIRIDFDDGFKPVVNKYEIFSNTSSASSEIGDNNSDKASMKNEVEEQPSEEDKKRYQRDMDDMINACVENVRKMEYEGTLKRSRKILDANFAAQESRDGDV